MRGIIRNDSREVTEGPDHHKALQAIYYKNFVFTRSEMRAAFLWFLAQEWQDLI